jgi:RimJ/RimL family protein N-acetyltransferase
MPESSFSQSAGWQTHHHDALHGFLVNLEPLSRTHTRELLAVVPDERIWRFLTSCASTEDSLELYIAEALKDREAGTSVPFVVRWRDSGALVGSTRLKDYSRLHQRVTVGSWFVPAVWGKGANTESKLLLLNLAFDQLGCVRVEFNTDSRNLRSRAALKGLGAVEEGMLRSWGVTREGERRDNVVFSILQQEWPEARRRLLSRLNEIHSSEHRRLIVDGTANQSHS